MRRIEFTIALEDSTYSEHTVEYSALTPVTFLPLQAQSALTLVLESTVRQKEELMRIGYVRVSKQEQHEALQIDALKEAGCEKWFVDKMTGSKAERKGLNEALAYLRPGDTLVVWKLDRAGRSLPHLIELLKDLQGRGIDFLSITEKIDTTTPGGKLVFHLFLLVVVLFSAKRGTYAWRMSVLNIHKQSGLLDACRE